MSKFVIKGGSKLYGSIDVSSAKNSVLPLIAASILAKGDVVLKNCERLTDVIVMCEIFKSLGGDYTFKGKDLYLFPQSLKSFVLPPILTASVRASLFFVGPLLSLFGKAEITAPGGCKIGTRPIDLHLKGLEKLGAICKFDGNKYEFFMKDKKTEKIKLSYPSVGATENLIMASVFGEGEVVIENCAKEPEILDLQNFLNCLGFCVFGAGSSTVVVRGVEKIKEKDVVFTPVPDRIEAGTFLLTTAFVGGNVTINNINIKNINIILKNIRNNTCKIDYINGKILNIESNGVGDGLPFIRTGPYPMFASDLQPQYATYCLGLNHPTVICETVFDNRFGYVGQLERLGAKILRGEGRIIVLPSQLFGNKVFAGDLRGGVALVMAGLKAEGITEVEDVEYVDRGYYSLENKLSALGANIVRE